MCLVSADDAICPKEFIQGLSKVREAHRVTRLEVIQPLLEGIDLEVLLILQDLGSDVT